MFQESLKLHLNLMNEQNKVNDPYLIILYVQKFFSLWQLHRYYYWSEDGEIHCLKGRATQASKEVELLTKRMTDSRSDKSDPFSSLHTDDDQLLIANENAVDD